MEGSGISRRGFLLAGASLALAACAKGIHVDNAFSERLHEEEHNPGQYPFFDDLHACRAAVEQGAMDTEIAITQLDEAQRAQKCLPKHKIEETKLTFRNAIREIFRNCGNIEVKDIGRETYAKIFEIFLKRSHMERLEKGPQCPVWHVGQ